LNAIIIAAICRLGFTKNITEIGNGERDGLKISQYLPLVVR
jgi:hypothetical protein